MTTFLNKVPRAVALQRLDAAGWRRRAHQAGGDYEDFVRASGSPGLLLVDFALGRFILDPDGTRGKLYTHNDDAEGFPPYDAVLYALYEGDAVK